MQKTKAGTMDYDELCRLFKLDPEEFERHRRQLIEEEIARRPPEIQDRLRKFQWVLDMKRKRCRNSLEACFMFHEMLLENVYGENGLLKNMERLVEAAKGVKLSAEPTSPPVATRVLDFPAEGGSMRMNCG